jgi:hypothetical protein
MAAFSNSSSAFWAFVAGTNETMNKVKKTKDFIKLVLEYKFPFTGSSQKSPNTVTNIP